MYCQEQKMKTILLNYNNHQTMTLKGAITAPVMNNTYNQQAKDIDDFYYGTFLSDKTYSRAIKNYTLAFLGAKTNKGVNEEANKPVYAIDIYGNYKRFASVNVAASRMNTGINEILKCTNGDEDCANGFAFAFAEDIEEYTRSGMRPDSIMVNLAVDILKSLKDGPGGYGAGYPFLSIEHYLEIQNENSVSFSDIRKSQKLAKKKEPIYAIGYDGSLLRFNSPTEAAQKLSIPLLDILLTLDKKISHAGNSTFCFASEIEIKNDNNTFVNKDSSPCFDKTAFKKLLDNFHNSGYLEKADSSLEEPAVNNEELNADNFSLNDIPEESASNSRKQNIKPFYVMNSNGDYRKFFTQRHVAKALGVGRETVAAHLADEQKLLQGFAFAFADDVEIMGRNGRITLNLDVLRNKFKEKGGIYLIDKEGKYQKFKDARDAIETLGIPRKPLMICLLGKQKLASGYAVYRASEVEIENPDGSITIDTAKINEAKLKTTDKAVMLINPENGTFKRYDNQTEAAKGIGAEVYQISACLAGRAKTVSGHIVVRANEVEESFANGTVVVDDKKIKEIIAASETRERLDVSKNGFYVFDKKGEYRKFYSLIEAAKELNLQQSSISMCLKGVLKTTGGYACALAEDVETRKKDGTIVVGKAKIAKILTAFVDKTLYAINKNGTWRRFESPAEASRELGVPLKRVSECLSGKLNVSGDYAFVSADKMELKKSDDVVTINKELIDEKVNYMHRLELYVVDKDKNYRKFSDKLKAAEELGVDRGSIGDCLSGKRTTAGGYAYISANEVEQRLEDGTVIVDEDKIKEIAFHFNL